MSHSLLLNPLVNDGHILQVVNVAAFNNEHSASDLQDVADLQRMQAALLAFWA